MLTSVHNTCSDLNIVQEGSSYINYIYIYIYIYISALCELLTVPGRSLLVLGRHCALLEVSLGCPGAPQNVESELGSSSGAFVIGNKNTKNNSTIFKTCQSAPRSSFGFFGDALRRPRGPGVSLESGAGRPWRPHGSPLGPIGTSLGVLKDPLGALGLRLRSFGGFEID